MTRRHRHAITIALAAVAGTAAFLAPERPGYVLNGDVTAYFGSASSLVRDGTLRHPIGTIFDETTDAPLAHWPPGYPVALALPVALGASPAVAARIVRGASAAAAVALVVTLVWSIAGAGAALLAAAMAAVTPSIVGVHMTPLSEAFFTALVVVLVFVMVRRPREPLLYGLVAAAVVLTRYVGVAFAFAACGWALLQPGTMARRLGRAILAGVPTLVTQLAWLAWTRSVSGNVRNVGEQAALADTVRRLVGAVSRWFAPGLGEGIAVPLVKLAVAAAFGTIVAWGALRLRRLHRETGDQRAAQALSLFAITAVFSLLYYAVYVLARLYADYALDFHPRYWAPLELLFAAVLAISLGVAWRERRRALGIVGTVAVGAWLLAATLASSHLVAEARAERVAWDAAQARSGLLAWIRTRGAGREIFSNWGAMLYHYAGRSSRELPIVDDPALDSLLARRVRASDALLVNFSDRDPVWMLPPGRRYVDPDTLAARLGMRPAARFPDGVVYALPPGVGGGANVTASDR